MSLQDVFEAALLRTVGPLASERGFHRSRRVWRRVGERGDWVAFDVQSSQWDTADSIQCIVNLGAAPGPWLDFEAESVGAVRRDFAPPAGIFQLRIASPTSDDGEEVWWHMETPAEAATVAAEIAQRMLDHGFPLLDELLERDAMLTRLRNGRMGIWDGARHDHWLAVALADDGPSPDLDEALGWASEWMEPERFALLRDWCSDRAGARAG